MARYPVLLAFLVFLSCGTGRFQGPKVISEDELDYPLNAQRNRMQGDVVVGVFVDKNGEPLEVNLIESSGHEILDRAAVEFAGGVEFQPAMIDSEPVAAWTRLVLRYKLSEIYFKEERWLAQVASLNKRAGAETDSSARLEILQNLFTQGIGLVNYVERHDHPDINRSILRVVTPVIRERYDPFWGELAAPFAVFDDMLQRYPETSLSRVIKEELIRQLVEAEYRIRIKALKARRWEKKSETLLDLIKRRLNELQQASYNP